MRGTTCGSETQTREKKKRAGIGRGARRGRGNELRARDSEQDPTPGREGGFSGKKNDIGNFQGLKRKGRGKITSSRNGRQRLRKKKTGSRPGIATEGGRDLDKNKNKEQNRRVLRQ